MSDLLEQALDWQAHGYTPVPTKTDGSKSPLIAWAKSPTATSQLVDLSLPAGAVPQVPVALIEEINVRGNIPLLTWVANETSDGSRVFRQQVLRILQHKNQLMLRPILRAPSAKTYREAWQRMAKSYRATGDTSIVWVWTPPRPDSIAAYFPGSAHVTWVAIDCRTAPTADSPWTSRYTLFRRQIALQIEIQSKPILLFTDQRPPPNAYQGALQVVNRYPEIKGIMFAPDTSSLPAGPGEAAGGRGRALPVGAGAAVRPTVRPARGAAQL